jgi:hypothetical protein
MLLLVHLHFNPLYQGSEQEFQIYAEELIASAFSTKKEPVTVDDIEFVGESFGTYQKADVVLEIQTRPTKRILKKADEIVLEIWEQLNREAGPNLKLNVSLSLGLLAQMTDVDLLGEATLASGLIEGSPDMSVEAARERAWSRVVELRAQEGDPETLDTLTAAAGALTAS